MTSVASESVAFSAKLGEGPVWDAQRQCIFWVDIDEGLVLQTDHQTTQTAVYWSSSEPVTSVAITESGSLWVSLTSSVVQIDCNRELSVLADVGPLPAGVRLNDCGVDPAGRYWVGSLGRSRSPTRSLYTMSESGALEPRLTTLTIGNGMDWSPCGQWMYLVDSGRKSLTRFSYDCDCGEVDLDSAETIFLDWFPGEPDGLWIDAEGGIWVALWDGHSLLRFAKWGDSSPKVVTVAGARPTSAAFVGPALDELFLTMAGDGTDRAEPYLLAGLGSGRMPHRISC